LFLDLGSHALDLLDFYLGPIASVSGQGTNQAASYTANDVVTGSWVFDSGAHGIGSWCFAADRELDELR